jgi:hypothetical protein
VAAAFLQQLKAITLPDNRTIDTLREAYDYIENEVPKPKQNTKLWLWAIRRLHRAITDRQAWVIFAALAFSRAVHAGDPKPIRTEPNASHIDDSDCTCARRRSGRQRFCRKPRETWR